MPINVSDNTTARVYGTPRAAYERARILYLEDPSQPNATASWRLVDQQLNFNATQLREGLTLAIDGRQPAIDSYMWDGTVTVHFDLLGRATQETATDAVALKNAPVLMHHPLQRVETFMSTDANDTSPSQQYFVAQLDDAREKSRHRDAHVPLQPTDRHLGAGHRRAGLRQHARARRPHRDPRDAGDRRSRRARADARSSSSCGDPGPASDITRLTAAETWRRSRRVGRKRGVLCKAGRVIFGKALRYPDVAARLIRSQSKKNRVRL